MGSSAADISGRMPDLSAVIGDARHRLVHGTLLIRAGDHARPGADGFAFAPLAIRRHLEERASASLVIY